MESAQRYICKRRGRDVVRIAELEGIRDWKIHAAPIEVEAVDLET